ncbi:hypothetical protein L1887_08310 [Cichorium endivia]|nr:hypothetical protein L1887_08310 [Cichorium endivia]
MCTSESLIISSNIAGIQLLNLSSSPPISPEFKRLGVGDWFVKKITHSICHQRPATRNSINAASEHAKHPHRLNILPVPLVSLAAIISTGKHGSFDVSSLKHRRQQKCTHWLSDHGVELEKTSFSDMLYDTVAILDSLNIFKLHGEDFRTPLFWNSLIGALRHENQLDCANGLVRTSDLWVLPCSVDSIGTANNHSGELSVNSSTY